MTNPTTTAPDVSVYWTLLNPYGIVMKSLSATDPLSAVWNAGHVNDALVVQGLGALLVATDAAGIWMVEQPGSSRSPAARPLTDNWDNNLTTCLAQGPHGQDHFYVGTQGTLFESEDLFGTSRDISPPGVGTVYKIVVTNVNPRRIVIASDGGVFWSNIPLPGDLPGPRAFPPLVHEELERFEIHLDSVCGVALATRISQRQWVGKFLTNHFGSASIDIHRIHSEDIVKFIVQPTNHYRTGTLNVLGGALRSYLRFRAVSCGDKVEALLAAVPTVAKWRLDTVPKHLTTEEVAGLLGAIDQHNLTGRRDYAMTRCLLDMGLRVSEVAAIQLDDLNWREGTLTITHGKSRRSDVLPLPVATGKAIVQYVRCARPPSTSRALFVRHRAPFNTPINWNVLTSASS